MSNIDQAHSLETLFKQLGFPADEVDIDHFVKTHQLSSDVKLTEAEFWSCNQKEFLIHGFRQDAEWSQVMDELNILLHSQG